jgi:hypothetical protein
MIKVRSREQVADEVTYARLAGAESAWGYGNYSSACPLDRRTEEWAGHIGDWTEHSLWTTVFIAGDEGVDGFGDAGISSRPAADYGSDDGGGMPCSGSGEPYEDWMNGGWCTAPLGDGDGAEVLG